MPQKKGFVSPYSLLAIGVVLIGLVVWQFYKYKIANRNIHKIVNEKSKGLYSIHYDNLVIDEVAGVLHVKNIEIIPDTVVYNQMLKERTNPPALIKLSIPALDILMIKTPKALLTKEIEGSKIEISNPTIEIELGDLSKDTTLHNPAKDVYRQLLGNFLKIRIDSVQINHANLVVRTMKSGAIVCTGVNVSFLLSDLLIDSTADKDSSRIFFSKNVGITCDEISLPSKNKKYRFVAEKLQFVSQTNSFYTGSIRLIPQLSESEFARASVTQKDRYDFLFEGISLLALNRESLWHKKIEADNLIIQKSSFKIYRDLSYPRDKLSRVGKYPHQQLMDLPVPLFIRKITLEQSFIEYKEKNAKSDSAGKVQFYNVHATISNITNIQAAISRDNKCVVLFDASFLNKAPVHARLILLLKDAQGKFSIGGNIGAIDAVRLNALTQPMGLARIEKGNVNNLHFNFTGNDSSSDGRLLILYNDIKISLLKKDEEENKYNKKVLPSLAANFLIKNSNPGAGGKTRVADVHYDRDTNKSFFNLLWKSIFTGIKQSAGMK